MKNFIGAFFIVLFVAFSKQAGAADVYELDTVHSSIAFSIRHMMVSKTTGVFNEFNGTILFDPSDLAGSKFDIDITAASLDTRNEARDNHLRNQDFFEVGRYPKISFKTRSLVRSEDGSYVLTGDLTMKAVTKEVSFPVSILGPVANPMGGDAIGIEGAFKLNRQDYGVSFNKTLDNGGLMIGDEVDVVVNFEAHKAVKK